MAFQDVAASAKSWVGRADIKFHHATSPVSLEETDGSQTDILKVCEQSTPPCQLNPLLLNGHLQTMWTATKNHGPQIHYRRKVFDADHKIYHGTFCVDFVVPPYVAEADPKLPPRTTFFKEEEFAKIGSNDSKPQLIVLHGLSGGSHEVYLRHGIEPLIRTGKWDVCVINSRGCAMSPITSGVLYNARATWDIRQTVKWFRKNFPNRPLFALGFSLGANILTNYVGEEGSNCVLKAALSCSNPFNLDVSSKMLQSTFLGKEIYLRAMGTSMRALIDQHKKEIFAYTTIDPERLAAVTYLNDFDREVQCPTWGYPTASAYYRDSSSSDSILAIRIPFMALNATDDPIAVNAGIPYDEFRANPSTVLCTTSLGGHIGWFETGGGRWFAQPIYNFFNHMAFKVNLEKLSPQPEGPVIEAHDGATFDPLRRRLALKD